MTKRNVLRFRPRPERPAFRPSGGPALASPCFVCGDKTQPGGGKLELTIRALADDGDPPQEELYGTCGRICGPCLEQPHIGAAVLFEANLELGRTLADISALSDFWDPDPNEGPDEPDGA